MDILQILLFNVIMFALAEIPLAGLLIAPDSTVARVHRVNAWFAANGRRIAVVLFALLGVFLDRARDRELVARGAAVLGSADGHRGPACARRPGLEPPAEFASPRRCRPTRVGGASAAARASARRELGVGRRRPRPGGLRQDDAALAVGRPRSRATSRG